MATTKAWHLRQDGTAFPVNVHLYVMDDPDLSSEAEVASFLIKTESSDTDLAKYVLDAWMAMLVEEYVDIDATSEDVDNCILSALQEYGPVGYQSRYCLSNVELLNIHNSLNNYKDYDSLQSFITKITSDIHNMQLSIKQSINQQFCRVRFGGKYDSERGNNGIWFRISSTGYNWDNTIYQFVSDMKRQLRIETITICRDAESDLGFDPDSASEKFYVSKDRTAYRDMPINEFLSEEHESSPVFAASNLNGGVIHLIKVELVKGKTLRHIFSCIENEGIQVSKFYNVTSLWRRLVNNEIVANTVSIK